MLNLNIFRLYYYVNIKSHVKLISLCYVKMFTKKKMHFRFYLLILKKKITSAKHQTPYNCDKNNINNFFYPIYFTYIQTLHKNNEFCTVIYSGVEKYITRKLSTSNMCVFFKALGKAGTISKYEINQYYHMYFVCTWFTIQCIIWNYV